MATYTVEKTLTITVELSEVEANFIKNKLQRPVDEKHLETVRDHLWKTFRDALDG
ncbi:MAG: hypothetical protein JKY33_10785 [Bacteroidia bacterium]|nr:hypothetical protein [Bacteroidia bacterium]